MKLTYRTRGGISPQGKPRVYLTGHPKDLDAYSEEIFKDILRIQNCAVYYDLEPEHYDPDELFQILEQMQLIVLPVTSRFLYQPNRAGDVEFKFAVEHHIPLLPLLQEPGLENAFNEKYGNLQMLNKNDSDPTVLPYAEKLEKFLISVLVGDELAEKIREAFDVYVFLSYRKKDRRFAQNLMRLIHKNDFCRNIAIWYDEFLVPGENFDQAIADAMKKCHLFTLAVTPNLLEPDNYVMTTEYPEAKKIHKAILPVELVATDKSALKTAFPDIGDCAQAWDKESLSDALLQSIRQVAIRENDSSPEHNFFIGLAYLNGIDVEVNRDYALSLITGAAEVGLPEAMEKLVNMYRSGDGVTRDYHAAVQWQKRLADHRYRQFHENGTAANKSYWISDLWQLGDYQKELNDLSAAAQTFRQMMEICQRLSEPSQLAVSYMRLGDIFRMKNRMNEARDYYQQALELNRQLCDKFGSAQSEMHRLDLAVSYDRLGAICAAERNLAGAEDYYRQALELHRQLSQETGTVQARQNLACAYDRLGDICSAKGNLTGAKDYYRQTLELRKQLLDETGTLQARQALSASYGYLGDISKSEGHLDEARRYYLQAHALDQQLYEETGTMEALLNLSIGYESLGDICITEKRPGEAEDYYRQVLELRRQLCQETGTVKARSAFSLCYKKLADLLKAGGKLAEAKSFYLHALELDRQLYEETSALPNLLDLSDSYDNLGDISRQEGRPEEAREYYLLGLEPRRQLCEEYGIANLSVTDRVILSGSYDKVGDTYWDEKKWDEAGGCYLHALEQNQLLCQETGTIEARQSLSDSYRRLGEVFRMKGRYTEAKEYFCQSLKLYMQLCDETGTIMALERLALTCCLTAYVSDAEEAKMLLAQAWHTYVQLHDRYPEDPRYTEYQGELDKLLKKLEEGNWGFDTI